jgi:hypothetical protein
MTTRTWWGVSVSILLCARFAAAEVCESARHSFELDPSPGTELDVGRCYEQQHDAAQAQRWYRDAQRRFAIAGNAEGERFARERADVIDAVASVPPAIDHRRTWRGVFVGSTVVAAIGGALVVYGEHQMSDATAELCAGGAYHNNSTCPMPGAPLTPEQVARLNQQGFQGKDLVIAGGVTVGLAGAIAIVSAYEGWVREEPSHRDGVMIAPVVGGSAAGAVASWRW